MTAQLSVGKMGVTTAATLVFDTVVGLVEKKAVVSVGMTVEQKVSRRVAEMAGLKGDPLDAKSAF